MHGKLTIGGSLKSPGSITLFGDLRGQATIQIVRGIDGGTITLPSIRTDNFTAGRLLVDGPFRAGSIALSGDMDGKLLVSEFKPASGTVVPTIVIDGNVTGVLDVRGEMHNALLELNRTYGSTSGITKYRYHVHALARQRPRLLDGGVRQICLLAAEL